MPVPAALLLLSLLQGDDNLASHLVVPEGLEARLWARAPMFFNPTNLDVDARGRVWVAEAVNYRGFNTKAHKPLWHEHGDRIMVLEDQDHDGVADRSWVFVQDPDLTAPLGLAVLGNQVIVSCSPNLIVYTDVDGDGHFDPKVDRKDKLLTGFGGFDHDHSLHALVAGPDGRWYFNVGNAGPHVVTDRAGWTLRSGSWYTGGSPYNQTNTPGLKSDDGRVWVGGLFLGMRPDGTGLRVLGHNFRNSYEVCVDSFGHFWQTDNDDEQSCRTTFLMEGGNAGYSSADGARSWDADRRPGQSVPTAHWRQEDPGVIPAGDVYGAGAPTGMVRYESGALGPGWGGLLLACEAGRNVVWGYRPKPEGAGFKLERFRFVSTFGQDDPNYVWSHKSPDPRKWFRPSDVAVGADGAVYVADWFDPIVGGHAMADKAGSGAIYRITQKGDNPQTPAVDPRDAGGALQAVRSPAVHVRWLGAQALRARGAGAVDLVMTLLTDPDPFVQARSLWLFAALGNAGIEKVEATLDGGPPDLRVVAFRALRAIGHRVREHLETVARDPSPAVRREAAIALRDVPVDQCLPLLLELVRRHQAGDRWSLEAVGMACDRKEDAVWAQFATTLPADALQWSAAWCEIAWRLHPAAAVPALAARALAPTLPVAARRQATDALAFVAARPAAEALLRIAREGPADLRRYAVWWLRHNDQTRWKEFQLAQQLGPASDVFLGSAPPPPGDPAFVSGVLRRGGVDVDVDLTGATRLWLAVDDTGDGIACDWADWADARLLDAAGETPLTALTPVHQEIGWGRPGTDRTCEGRPMKILGRPIPRGLGTHANSVLVFDLPPGRFTRLRAFAGVDDGAPGVGGADSGGNQGSVRFAVFHDGPTEGQRATELRARLLDPAATAEARQTAARTLAGLAQGGVVLLALAESGKLPADVRPLVAERIFTNPDPSVRALASRCFLRPGSNPQLPPIAQLAALRGDATRGRDLFFGRAGCSACHALSGAGKEIGPDLTAVGGKFDRPALLDAMLNPSAAILTGYEAWLVETTDGTTLCGFVLAEGDPLLLKDTSGQRHAIAKARIASRRRQEGSIMPDNIALELPPQDLADLAELLLHRKP